ncbi:MAG: hypothetical protein M3004_04475 [Bacteroidota bacterium]|nr:hypothetical protein [Bacteroidota bacterium]
MDEEENIEEQSTDDRPQSTENESVSEIQTTNQKLQTEQMEVHKHPHHVTHKKKWGEYLLEFFMLFLAVFLGFLAENFRVNNVNREIEKHNIESLLRNLEEDKVNLERSIEVNKKRFSYLDSLMYLKKSNVEDEIFKKKFIFYMLKLGYIDYFISNESTYEQMKSSGTLRLLSHRNVLDSILNYETHYRMITRQEELCSKWWDKSIEQVSGIIDLTALAILPPNTLWSMSEKDLSEIQLPDFTKDVSILQPYYNWRINERIALGYYLEKLDRQLLYLNTLIPFLQKEYRIENE